MVNRLRLTKLFESKDPIIRYLALNGTFIPKELEANSKPLLINGVEFPLKKQECEKAWARVLHSSVNGQGLAHHSPNNEYKSFWVIDKQSKLSGREYCISLPFMCAVPTFQPARELQGVSQA